MRRPRRSRYDSWSHVETMGSLPPPSPSKMRPSSRDTGFPSSFDGHRNTTLPHPDADTSPNASISADDIAIHRVLSRQRRSFLAKHKRTVSHGMITPEMERTYSDLAQLHENEALSAVDSKHSEHSRLSKDGGASFASSNDSGVHVESSTPSRSFDSTNNSNMGHKRRRSLLLRLIHR